MFDAILAELKELRTEVAILSNCVKARLPVLTVSGKAERDARTARKLASVLERLD